MRLHVCLIVVFTIAICANTAIASSGSEPEWNTSVNHTLYWGDSIDVDGFVIKASDFSKARPFDVETDYVMLTINSNEAEEKGTLLSVNNSQIPDSIIFDEKLNITAFEVVTGNNIPAPYTKIGVSTLNITEEEADSWINNTICVTKTEYKNTYIDERAFITLLIENLQGLEFQNVTIKETLPENIMADPDIDIDQTIEIRPYSKNKIQYSIKALKPGNYTIPPTEIEIIHKGVKYHRYTNSTELVVYGPYINAEKKIKFDENEPQLLHISIKVKNVGNRAAYVKIEDELLPNSVLTQGNAETEQVIFPNKVKELEYTVRIKDIERNAIAPSAEIYFSDSKGYSDTFKTKRFYIFEQTEEETEPVDTLPEKEQENEKSITNDENQEETIEYPKFGPINSLKDIFGNTIRIINEALEYG